MPPSNACDRALARGYGPLVVKTVERHVYSFTGLGPAVGATLGKPTLIDSTTESITLLVNDFSNAGNVQFQNGLSKNQAAPRLALSARNTNVATNVTSNLLKGTKSRLQPASLKQAIVEVPKPVLNSVQIEKIPLPSNMVDIDEEDMEHLEFSSVYVKDIYQYLFKIEGKNAAHPQ